MKYLVFGSLNLDCTYSVPHFVSAGETLASPKMQKYCGGKGFNQAVALARSGQKVFFAGAVGEDGQMLLDGLAAEGIDDRFVFRKSGATGHAIIQLNPQGQNCILILAGANGEITKENIDDVLADFEAGDMILLQNEISNVDYILGRAKEKGLKIALNPSPWEERILSWDLSAVSYFLINEVEGMGITGETAPEKILDTLWGRFPGVQIVLTLGAQGSVYQDRSGKRHYCGIYATEAVDTTGAGDTFAGYFLGQITQPPEIALRRASVAAGIAVSRNGAAASIPFRDEVMARENTVQSVE